MQQRPLYTRVRTILTILSSLWLVAAIVGLGFFSGGTTSLAFSLILLYTTGAALLFVISAIYRFVTRAARQRVETVPEDNAAAVFVDTTRSATEEILAALRPAAPAGGSVRMPQHVDALDVAAALAARTAAMTTAAAAEKSAVAAAALVAPTKSAVKSPVNKSAVKKKSAPKQPAQPKKAQAGKSRPAAASRGAGSTPAKTAPKKTAGGKKSGSAGKGAGHGKGSAGGSNAGGSNARSAAASGGSRGSAAGNTPLMSVPGIRTAQQDVLPRLSGAPACGLAAKPERSAAAGRMRELVSAA